MLFLGLMDRKNPFNISAEGSQLILLTFSCLILKLKTPSGTSFGLYFAFAEYRTDDSNSPAERIFSPAEITVTLDSQSAESCSSSSPTVARSRGQKVGKIIQRAL